MTKMTSTLHMKNDVRAYLMTELSEHGEFPQCMLRLAHITQHIWHIELVSEQARTAESYYKTARTIRYDHAEEIESGTRTRDGCHCRGAQASSAPRIRDETLCRGACDAAIERQREVEHAYGMKVSRRLRRDHRASVRSATWICDESLCRGACDAAIERQ